MTRTERKKARADLAAHINKQAGWSMEAADSLAGKLLRDARIIDRVNEADCSYERPSWQLRADTLRQEQAWRRIQNNCARIGVLADECGDPRGFSVKIHFTYADRENRKPYNTWGGAETGWGIG